MEELAQIATNENTQNYVKDFVSDNLLMTPKSEELMCAWEMCIQKGVGEISTLLIISLEISVYALFSAGAMYSIFWQDWHTAVALAGGIILGFLTYAIGSFHLVDWSNGGTCAFGYEFPVLTVVIAWYFIAYYIHSYILYARWEASIFLFRIVIMVTYGLGVTFARLVGRRKTETAALISMMIGIGAAVAYLWILGILFSDRHSPRRQEISDLSLSKLE